MEGLKDAVKFLSDNQGALTVLLTAVYVVATLVIVILTFLQLRAAKKLEELRVRPIISFEVSNSAGVVSFVVRNLGQMSARNLVIQVEPELKCLMGGKGCLPPEEKEESISLLTKKTPTIASGQAVSGFVAFWERFQGRYPELLFKCKLAYEGPGGQEYQDAFELDLSSYKGLKTIKAKNISDIAVHLEDISQSLRKISSTKSGPG